MTTTRARAASSKVRLAVALAGVASAILVATAFGLFLTTADSGGTAQSGETEYRWRRLTFRVPDAANLNVTPRFPAPGFGDELYVTVAPLDDDGQFGATAPQLTIDADTGEVLGNTLSEYDAAAADFILSSIEVSDDIPSTWPYSDEDTQSIPQGRWEKLLFTQPAPSSGVVVIRQRNYCVDPCAHARITIHSGYSSMQLDASNGELLTSNINRPADQVAFERFRDTVTVEDIPVSTTPSSTGGSTPIPSTTSEAP